MVEKTYPGHPDLTGGGETDLHSHPGGGVIIATGSYVGNASSGRQIATGMKCSMVIIMRATYAWVLIPSLTTLHSTTSPYHIDKTGIVHLHASNGFTVGDADATNANATGATHYYWAISE